VAEIERDKVRSLLDKFANHPEYVEEIRELPPREAQEKLRRDFQIPDIVVPTDRVIPPTEVCGALLNWVDSFSEYDDVAATKSVLQPIYMVVGHAMPLVVSAEDAVVAAR
jgi:hypothetical protein